MITIKSKVAFMQSDAIIVDDASYIDSLINMFESFCMVEFVFISAYYRTLFRYFCHFFFSF